MQTRASPSKKKKCGAARCLRPSFPPKNKICSATRNSERGSKTRVSKTRVQNEGPKRGPGAENEGQTRVNRETTLVFEAHFWKRPRRYPRRKPHIWKSKNKTEFDPRLILTDSNFKIMNLPARDPPLVHKPFLKYANLPARASPWCQSSF